MRTIVLLLLLTTPCFAFPICPNNDDEIVYKPNVSTGEFSWEERQSRYMPKSITSTEFEWK